MKALTLLEDTSEVGASQEKTKSSRQQRCQDYIEPKQRGCSLDNSSIQSVKAGSSISKERDATLGEGLSPKLVMQNFKSRLQLMVY